MLIRYTYECYDAGWGCTYRAGQMLVANSVGGRPRPPPVWGDPGFGARRGHVHVAHYLASEHPHVCVWPSVAARLVLVPIRAGVARVEPRYWPRLLELFACPYFIGATVGLGSGSLYMHRADDRRAYCLDPHTIGLRARGTVSEAALWSVALDRLSPSMCLGFMAVPADLWNGIRAVLDRLPIA